jgi:hypothetical protein
MNVDRESTQLQSWPRLPQSGRTRASLEQKISSSPTFYGKRLAKFQSFCSFLGAQ